VPSSSRPEPDAARAACGDAIYAGLAGLKRQYDPANVFCRNQNVRLAP
jgi:FAD/FMN-containing dehydrogenase